MNKKLLFAAMSLVAFTACTDSDFESQKVAEETSSVQFEVLNNSDAFTRASMNGNKVSWSAADGDLFTLYHGAGLGATTGYQNATYKATVVTDKPATLTTPTMINPGAAIMVWPVDTTFRYVADGDKLVITIPVVQGGKVKVDETEKDIIQNQIPYVSDQINIGGYAAYSETTPAAAPSAWNTAGKDRKYPVYMRPMASQLNLIAEYDGMDDLADLSTGTDAIDPIKLTSVDLLTRAEGADLTLFTTAIPVKFTEAGATSNWADVPHNAWARVTGFDVEHIAAAGQVNKLTTKHLNGNESCKFLILPQATMATEGKGVADAAIVVNTIYGKVVIAKPGVAGTKYVDGEWEDAWFRYLSAIPAAADVADGETTIATPVTVGGKTKYKTTSAPEFGLKQTINAFSTAKVTTEDSPVFDEPVGVAATRYVNVLLSHLDMSDLHIKSDKQLYDVVRVWDKLGLDKVTVILDGGKEGDANGEFTISQKTIAKINAINIAKKAKSAEDELPFKVKPCVEEGESCTKIVITGGGVVPNVAFIAVNDKGTASTDDDVKADVVFKAGETWNWTGTVKVTAAGVNQFVNKGTMQNTAGATLATAENVGEHPENNVPLVNDGTWTISGGELNVQFSVTNNGTVTIAAGAEYRQAKASATINTTFTNQATAKPTRFGGDDSKIGKVVNNGVFATLATGGSEIINYGVIDHASPAAKTYITKNETDPVSFATEFGNTNKMGMIIIDYSNKDEDNISVTHALNEGFVAVKVNADNAPSDKKLNATVVGPRVNYVIINGGIETIEKLPAQIQYVEINDVTASPAEIAWSLIDDPETSADEASATYQGLMVLSKVNIKLGTTITVAKATYLGANMYVGGIFNKGSWTGYYGNTAANEATKYITY